MADRFQPLAPIKVEAPPVSILTAARRLPAGTVWRSGISHLPNGCTPASNYVVCEVDSTPPDKADMTPGNLVSFRPWPIYLPDGCDVSALYGEDWEGRSSEALDAYTAWALSREMSDGAASGNPSLESCATALTGAVDPVSALSRLYRARIAAGFGGMATAHVPIWMMPALYDALQLDANGVATTLGGMVKVSQGPGYTGASPAGIAAVADHGWIYITGPVEYELGPIEQLLGRDDQHAQVNQVRVIAERMAIYRMDCCGVFAIETTIGCSV